MLRRSLASLKKKLNDAFYPSPPVKSYSQQGEDLVLAFLLEEAGVKAPYYLDIGANDPVTLSNTFLFYTSGGRGTCVEPNKRYNSRFAQHRPEDALLNFGVSGCRSGTLPYYEMDWPEFNTFDEAQAKAAQSCYAGRNNIKAVQQIPVVPINELLEHYVVSRIDLLSLDVEGYDLDILSHLDFSRWSPFLVCVEHREHKSSHATDIPAAMTALLSGRGYELVARNTINGIYQLNE